VLIGEAAGLFFCDFPGVKHSLFFDFGDFPGVNILYFNLSFRLVELVNQNLVTERLMG